MSKRFILGGNRGEPSKATRRLLDGRKAERYNLEAIVGNQELWSTVKRRWILELMYQEYLGFEFRHVLSSNGVIENCAPLPSDTEVIYLCFSTHDYDIDAILKYIEPCKDAAVIFETAGDRRMWHKQVEELKPFLDRVTIVLDNQKDSWGSKQSFRKVFPQFANKHVFFPECFAPDWEYSGLLFNEDPIMKCIVSGRIAGRYALRNALIEHCYKDKELHRQVDWIRHPQYDYRDWKSNVKGNLKVERVANRKVWDEYITMNFIHKAGSILKRRTYADKLNEYFCGIAANGGNRCQIVIMKHLEVPAVGVLMLAEPFLDLKTAGFVAGEHYVPISQDNVGKVIKDVLSRPEKYDEVRRKGMAFVRANHSVNNRFEQFKELLGGLV